MSKPRIDWTSGAAETICELFWESQVKLIGALREPRHAAPYIAACPRRGPTAVLLDSLLFTGWPYAPATRSRRRGVSPLLPDRRRRENESTLRRTARSPRQGNDQIVPLSAAKRPCVDNSMVLHVSQPAESGAPVRAPPARSAPRVRGVPRRATPFPVRSAIEYRGPRASVRREAPKSPAGRGLHRQKHAEARERH